MKHEGMNKCFDFQQELYKYGNIVRCDVAGKRMAYIFDPAEYMKIHRAAGSTPLSSTSELWFFTKYYSDPRVRERYGGKMPMAFQEGTSWQKARHALQPGIFGSEDAMSYQPALVEVAAAASKALPSWTATGEDMQEFINRITFELIVKVILGRRIDVLSRESADPRDVRFIKATLALNIRGGTMLRSPLGEWNATLGLPEWKHFVEDQNYVMERSDQLVREALESRPTDSSMQEDSCLPWLYRLIKAGDLSHEEIVLNVAGFLQGGVDTTGNAIYWNLVHLAANPHEQDKLAEQLRQVGDVPLDTAALQSVPLLSAVVRESHRLTPAVAGAFRRLSAPIELLDQKRTGSSKAVSMPGDISYIFSTLGLSMDPAIIDAPHEFRPERWLSSKEERKGTPMEVLDHRLMSQPFSFGPRMCIGARVAQVEMNLVLARFVRDYRFTLDPEGQQWGVVFDGFFPGPSPAPTFKFEPRS